MPDVTDIAAFLPKIEDALAKLKGATKIKGNRPPDTKHFPPGSIVADGGILADEQRVWVSFQFEEPDKDDLLHTIKATMKLDEIGKPGGEDIITIDGKDVENDDVVQGVRTGLEGLSVYSRAIFEFRGTLDGEKFHIRFDVG